MIDLRSRLEEIGAPDALVRSTGETSEHEDETLGGIWDRCRRGDHRLWLAAVAGVPVERIVEAAGSAILFAATGREGAEALAGAIERALGSDSPEECLARAARCEELAERGPGGYRSGPSAGFAALARGAGLVARACEGLIAAEAALSATRRERARRSATLLGAGEQALLGPDPGPAAVLAAPPAHPARHLLCFTVAACAQAVDEACASISAPEDELEPSREALDEVGWEALELEG
ncbi:MAG: hypothetical protein IT378_09875 [Sandaracinaceae bacterium]|nr:hypothetical protein [Sandaracinaceae bacterium]